LFKKRADGEIQGFIRGDGQSIFEALIKGGTRRANGTVLLKDGTIVGKHFSIKSGEFTIDINKAGQIYKIRIIP
jgi:hypothetical protein